MEVVSFVAGVEAGEELHGLARLMVRLSGMITCLPSPE
jgi:hypothetical protein